LDLFFYFFLNKSFFFLLFFFLIRPLVSEEGDSSASDTEDVERIQTESNAVSRISHMIKQQDTDAFYKLIFVARKHFGKVGD
jgi:hypothetical protein